MQKTTAEKMTGNADNGQPSPSDQIDRLSMALPNELKHRRQFLVWKAEPSAHRNKPLKVPYYVSGIRRNGIQGSDSDLANLATFSEALATMESGNYTGLGIAMIPGCGLVGGDLDHCFHNGELSPEFTSLIDGTYAEISPSGNGVRAFYTGFYGDFKHHDKGVEVFSEKGFLTLTGNQLNCNPIIPLPDRVKQEFDSIFNGNKSGKSRTKKLDDALKADPIYARLNDLEVIKKDFGGGKIGIVCPFEDDHTTGSGDGDCAYFLPHTNGYKHGHFHCLHAHCANRTRDDFLKAIGLEPNIQHQITTDWPEPVNLFDDFRLGPPQWEYGMCPEEIAEFAFDEAARMGVRPEQVAGPAIVSAAGVIDDRIQLQPKRFDETWTESARLWGAVIGGSGERKTPAKNRADAAIKDIEKSLYLNHSDRMKLYEVELQVYEALAKKERARTPPPVEPVRDRVICNDTTVEALRDILSDGGGATKITCLWDELSGMLSTFDAYRQSKSVSRDRSLYLELYNGGSKPIDRSGKVNIFVPNWSACISGTITPDVMSEYFGKLNSDGLLQRFLLYRAERTGRGVDRAPNQTAERQFKSAINRLFSYRPSAEQGTIVRLSDEAQFVRDSFEQLIDLAYHLPGNPPAYNAHLNKYPGLFCRLCLTYHLVSSFAGKGRDMAPTVSGEIAEMAAGALIEYHLPAARDFYQHLGYADQGQEAAKELCGYILSKGAKKITTREISASVWPLRNNTIGVRATMDVLTAYGWVRSAKVVNGNTTRWDVNPAVHKLYAEQAERERVERAAVRARIEKAVQVFGKHGG